MEGLIFGILRYLNRFDHVFKTQLRHLSIRSSAPSLHLPLVLDSVGPGEVCLADPFMLLSLCPVQW